MNFDYWTITYLEQILIVKLCLSNFGGWFFLATEFEFDELDCWIVVYLESILVVEFYFTSFCHLFYLFTEFWIWWIGLLNCSLSSWIMFEHLLWLNSELDILDD